MLLLGLLDSQFLRTPTQPVHQLACCDLFVQFETWSELEDKLNGATLLFFFGTLRAYALGEYF